MKEEIIYFIRKMHKQNDPVYPFKIDPFFYLVPATDVEEIISWDCYGVSVDLERLPRYIADAMFCWANLISGGLDEIEVRKRDFVEMVLSRQDFIFRRD